MANVVQNSNQTLNEEAIQAATSKKVSAMIRENLKYISSGTANQLLDELVCIGRIDDKYGRLQSWWLIATITSIGILLVSIFICFMSEMDSTAITFTCIAFFAATICVGFYKYVGRLNVPDRRYQIPLKILKYLKADIPPNTPINIEVGFEHYHSKQFQTGKSGGMMSTIKEFQYAVPWLHISSQLYDGTKFRLEVIQSVKRKQKSKRKSTKITETFRDKYNLNLAVKPTRYPGIANFEMHLKSAPSPMGLSTVKAFRKENRIKVQAMTTPRRIQSLNSTAADPLKFANAHPCLQLFLTAYHCLGLCRQS
jgi:hypothetical protein